MFTRTAHTLIILGLAAGSLAATAAPAPAATPSSTLTQSYPTPGVYMFTVPAGVTTLDATVIGAGGGADGLNQGCVPGKGDSISAEISVTAGQQLAVTVGGAGGNASGSTAGAGGAENGGRGGAGIGSGQNVVYGGGGGGGITRLAIADSAEDYVIAGGGGGCGAVADGINGDGGDAGTDGQAGPYAGAGLSASRYSSGGLGGGIQGPPYEGQAGFVDGGGTGGDGLYAGGGGGAGAVGGGGGGGAALGYSIGGGGAGGSDSIDESAATVVSESTAANTGDGSVSLSWSVAGQAVGSLFAPGVEGFTDDTLLQAPGSDSGSGYVVPVNGTIVGWAYEAGPHAPSLIELKTASTSSIAPDYSIDASSTAETDVQPDQINQFSADIPVAAGEVIGVYSQGWGDFGVTAQGDGMLDAIGNVQTGSLADFAPITYQIGSHAYGVTLPIEVFIQPAPTSDPTTTVPGSSSAPTSADAPRPQSTNAPTSQNTTGVPTSPSLTTMAFTGVRISQRGPVRIRRRVMRLTVTSTLPARGALVATARLRSGHRVKTISLGRISFNVRGGGIAKTVRLRLSAAHATLLRTHRGGRLEFAIHSHAATRAGATVLSRAQFRWRVS